MTKSILTSLVLSACLVMSAGSAQNDFPTEPITLIIPYGAGGMTDTSGRILANALGSELGTRVDVVNRPGAGGFLGLTDALRADADGHTIVAVTTDIFANTVLLDRDFSMDDVALVGSFMPQQRPLYAHPDAPWDDFDGFLDYARDNEVSFADGGALWAGNVVKAFAKQEELQVTHIPFDSGAEGSAALLGGHVDIGETGVGTPAWQAAKSGDLDFLVLLTDGTLEEFGFPEVENLLDKGYSHVVRMYYGLAVPGDTPEPIRSQLEGALEGLLQDDDVVARLQELDLTPEFRSADTYRDIIETVLVEAEDLKAYLDE